MEDAFRRLSRGYRYERNGLVSFFTTTFPLKIANKKEGFSSRKATSMDMKYFQEGGCCEGYSTKSHD